MNGQVPGLKTNIHNNNKHALSHTYEGVRLYVYVSCHQDDRSYRNVLTGY